jgi:excisionase family DNA binding protein
MSVLPLPGILTVSEAAAKASVSPWTIRQEIKRGNLRARRIGSCVRILDEELARFLHDYEANAGTATGGQS